MLELDCVKDCISVYKVDGSDIKIKPKPFRKVPEDMSHLRHVSKSFQFNLESGILQLNKK